MSPIPKVPMKELAADETWANSAPTSGKVEAELNVA